MSLDFDPPARQLLERSQEVARALGRQELTGECVVLAALSPELSTLAHRGADPPPPPQASPEMLPFSTALASGINSHPTPLALEDLVRMSLADGVSASSEIVDALAFLVRTRPFFIGGAARP